MSEFHMRATLVDDYGRTTKKDYYIEATDHADALAKAAAFNTDLVPLTKMRVLSYDVAQTIIVSDTADAGSNKDAGATFSVRKADNKLAPHRVPDPIASVINADGTIDLAAAEVVAYFANLLSGDVRISDGEVATEIVRGTLDK